ncbi:exportin 1-like protein [Coniella lustricola]|uniref:Exportin-T n=1 Tax=Coniella lustricola TaxID=2025994 RepID=A0A2T3AFJ8_9PEZI|nr:exportin 1-like protein [Coniella lustricola]
MESQIENAIEIAWNPHSDNNLKQQAFQFLANLRTDPQGWQSCVAIFIRDPSPMEVVRVVCLEVINNAIMIENDPNNLAALKDTFLDYVKRSYATNPQQIDSPTLQNKLTQTLTLLFVRLYKQGWESFLDDFLSMTSLPGSDRRDNPVGCVLYLRILLSVHDEIADQLLSRQPDEANRNVDLKDLVRERDMQKVARSWQEILAQYQDRDDKIVEMTLKVLGKWVQWIDITLVIQQDMINLLLPLIGRVGKGDTDKVRDAAVEAYTEITAKKMKPSDKMELIAFLGLQQIVSELVNSPPLNQHRGTAKYDTDLAEAVAKMVNVVMSDAVRVLETFSPDSTAKAEQHLQDFIPLLLRFFSDEFDEVCSSVIPSLTDVLTLFRKMNPLPPQYREMLPSILNAIILKMRYDETASWGNEDEQTDEAEFQELRKRLQNLQKSVAAVDQSLYLETLSNLVANTFQTLDQRGSQMDWRDLDLALYEMYLFGELALPNQGLAGKSQPSTAAAERLVLIMSKMVESDISNFPHPAILLQYMEICVRYAAFFENRQEYIPRVLENFVRLVHHEHMRVRVRSWYLFYRLVKHLRAQVSEMTGTVIQSIADLLTIKAEVSGDEADDDMSSDESDHSADAVFTNQLYLFEATGCISSTGAVPIEKQVTYARTVIEPLFTDMQNTLPRAKAGDAQAILQAHHIVTALGYFAHGFSDTPAGNNLSKQSPPAKEVSEVFSHVAEAILVALKELNSNSEIRTACRSAFSRLLGVLGSTVLPQLPQWIEGLLSQSSSNDEMAMFLRLLEQVVFGFKAEIYEILNMLLTPLLQRIFEGLSQPVTGTDDDIQLGELRREYIHFIQIILANDLGGVLVSETNQGYFESLISSIITLARTISHGNMSTSRSAFGLLQRMTAVWGGPDIAVISNNPVAPTGSPTPLIPGFDQFIIDRFHPLCWEVLKDPQFNPSDAQTRQVVNEIAQLEQTIYTKTGEVFIHNLRSALFPSLGIDGAEFLQYMSTDRKAFLNYLTRLSGSK